jgi:hypothetical protein
MRPGESAADPPVLSLGAGALRATVDPVHGAEIAQLLVSGRQVLSRTPWERRPPMPAAAEEDWLGAWAGGWQILFPSAGLASQVEGRWHPFHGASSQAPWTLLASSDTTATLSWTHDDWVLERRIALSGHALRVDTQATNRTTVPQPAVAVEHLTFGDELLDQGPVRLQSGAGQLQPLDADGAPEGPARPWPVAHGPDDWSLVPVAGPVSRFGCVRGLGDTSLGLRSPDLELQVRWDRSLPFLWYWLELDATGQPPWNGSTRALGLEPASYPHSLGLARACHDGSARLIGAGQSWSWFVEITVVAERHGLGRPAG